MSADFFSATELARFRSDHLRTLDQVCTLVTPGTMTDDGAGGSIEGAETTTTVDCRIRSLTAQETEIASRLSETVDAVVTMPYGTNVTSLHRVTTPDGETYETVSVNLNPPQSWRTKTEVFIRRIR